MTLSETPSRPTETVNLSELAAALNIGMTAAYEMARRDELPIPAIRVGRQFRFSRRALERLLDGKPVQENTHAA